jgi:hypothetical protein
MAKDEAKTPAEAAAEQKGVNVQLVPSADSERPVLSNFTTLHPAPGMVLMDFGFLEPGALAALSQMARSGKKMPERINGRLATRVAMSYDSLATLHQQIGRLLQAMSTRGKPQ